MAALHEKLTSSFIFQTVSTEQNLKTRTIFLNGINVSRDVISPRLGWGGVVFVFVTYEVFHNNIIQKLIIQSS